MRRAVALLLIAGSAAATYYIDERFDGTSLPPGWTYEKENTAGWYIYAGGPWGNYLYMYAAGSPTAGDGWINVYTKHVSVAVGALYYRFQTYRTWSGYTFVGSSLFALYQEGSSTPLASFSITNASWQVKEGMVTASGRPVYGRWRVSAGSWMSHGCSVALRVDTVQLSSLPVTGVGPASLGKVKALLR